MGEYKLNNVVRFQLSKPKQADPAMLELFVDSTIKMNIEALTAIVSVTKHVDPMYVIESYVFNIVAATLADKSKEEILTDLSGGGIYLLKDKLMEGFKKALKI